MTLPDPTEKLESLTLADSSRPLPSPSPQRRSSPSTSAPLTTPTPAAETDIDEKGHEPDHATYDEGEGSRHIKGPSSESSGSTKSCPSDRIAREQVSLSDLALVQLPIPHSRPKTSLQVSPACRESLSTRPARDHSRRTTPPRPRPFPRRPTTPTLTPGSRPSTLASRFLSTRKRSSRSRVKRSQTPFAGTTGSTSRATDCSLPSSPRASRSYSATSRPAERPRWS